LVSQLFIKKPEILILGVLFAFVLSYYSLKGKFNLVFRIIIINFTVAAILTSVIIAFSGNLHSNLLELGDFSSASTNLAILFFLRSMLGLYAIIFLASSTPIPQLLYALHILRVPNVIIELSSLILGFSYQILDQLFLMERAASSRIGFNGRKRALNTWGAIIGNLFGRSLEMAERKDAGLNSRLYTGTVPIFRAPAPLKLTIALFSLLPAIVLLVLQFYL
jgi:energy-coupling factor transporter transmembrane protein EcfT